MIADLSIGPNTLLAGNVTITTTATSIVGIATVELLIDDLVVGTALDPSKPSITFDTNTIADGSHQLNVRASDVIGGRTSTSVFAVTISNAEGRINNISLANDSFVRGTVNVTADIIDSAGIAQVRYFIDNFQPVISTDPRATFRLDTVALDLNDDRDHTFRITATNNLGREITSPTISFKVDNLAPTVTITSPAPGAFLRRQFNLLASAADNGPLGQLELSIDGDPRPDITRVQDGFLISTVNLVDGNLNFLDGNHVLAVRSVDQTGNDAVATLPVIFDNTAPTAAITSPTQNAAIRGAFDVVATLSDNLALGDTATVLLDPDPTPATAAESTVIQASVTQGMVTQRIEGASIPADGPHIYAVVAQDLAGNTVTSARLNVIIDNTPPVISNLLAELDQEGNCVLSGTITDASGVSAATLVTQSGVIPATTPVTASLTTPSFATQVASSRFLFATVITGTISAIDDLGNTVSIDTSIRTMTRNLLDGLTGCSLEAVSPALN